MLASNAVTSLTPPLNQADRFVHIDAMRAVAVLLVVVMHAGFTVVPGDSGVTIFFAISGFIITFILLKERSRTGRFSPARFYYRRALKLAPPFLLIVAIPTLVYAAFHPISWLGFGSQVLFTYNWVEIYAPAQAEATLPGTSVVWSLAVEEQFYIAFALLWIVLVKKSWWLHGVMVLSALAIASSFTVRVLTASIDPVHAMRGTDARMEAIAWGVLAACLLHQYRAGVARWIGRLGYDWAPVLAAVLYVGSFAVPDGWPELIFRPTLWAVAAVLVLLYGMLPHETLVKTAFFRVVAWRPIQIIGLASYSIYLIHFELRALINTLIGDSLPVGVVRALVIVAGIAGGVAVYFLVEIPASRLRNIPAARADRGIKQSSSPRTL